MMKKALALNGKVKLIKGRWTISWSTLIIPHMSYRLALRAIFITSVVATKTFVDV